VKALDYEHRLGYTEHRMDEFYPYTKKKLEHPTLIKIFDILLKKKYKNVHYTEQYYLLLKLKGDEEAFDRIMQ
jgi:hypothetical protein